MSSKRSFYPQQFGARKKPKLDVTVSDHNFPLSQNVGSSKASTQDNWGDDNDDEILLLASQACEDAYIGHDVTSVPDYTICMQPGSTSTQLCHEPGTSKSSFAFKKPINTVSQVSTNYKDKCNRISSPLHGITAKPDAKGNEMNLTDDLILNDQIFKGQDFEQMYKQMLQLKEENFKLKSENGKLLEKCVTKEGEASILRTQLKTCQVSIDHARLDKIRAQEKVQNEWTEKLNAATTQLQNLKTNLDFKNLEIISVKEKCKMLESSKVKLTQVTVNPTNDMSRLNSSFSGSQARRGRAPTAAAAAQTERPAGLVKLTKTYRRATSELSRILPLLLQPTEDQYSPADEDQLAAVRAEVTCLAASSDAPAADAEARVDRIVSAALAALSAAEARLTRAPRPTAAPARPHRGDHVEGARERLLGGGSLFKDEEGVEARRVAAVLCCVLAGGARGAGGGAGGAARRLLPTVLRMCRLVENNSCGMPYSGLLLSLAYLLHTIVKQTDNKTIHAEVLDIVKTMAMSRPMHMVTGELLELTARLATLPTFVESVCCGHTGGNLKVDHDQGVSLYKKETCYLQVLARQTEGALRAAPSPPAPCAPAPCASAPFGPAPAPAAARALLAVHRRLTGAARSCDCESVIFQTLVYSLQICAEMLTGMKNEDSAQSSALRSVCAAGVAALHRRGAGGGGGGAAASGGGGGYLRVFVERCGAAGAVAHCDVYATMLSELECWLQSAEEAAAAAGARRVWRAGLQRLRGDPD